MDLLPLLVVVVLVALLVGVLYRRLLGTVTIHEYERGVRFVRGKFVGLVDAGTSYYLKPMTQITVLDVRPTSMTIEGQEVLTSDRVALKISLVARQLGGGVAAAAD